MSASRSFRLQLTAEGNNGNPLFSIVIDLAEILDHEWNSKYIIAFWEIEVPKNKQQEYKGRINEI